MKYLYENPNQAMFIVPVDEHDIDLITSELKSKASSVMMNYHQKF